MTGRILVLAVVVLVSALGVVKAKHEGRKQFLELQKLQAARDHMNVEWGQLLLEEGAWAAHGRIEDIARRRLKMHIPSAGEVLVVTRDAPAGTALAPSKQP